MPQNLPTSIDLRPKVFRALVVQDITALFCLEARSSFSIAKHLLEKQNPPMVEGETVALIDEMATPAIQSNDIDSK